MTNKIAFSALAVVLVACGDGLRSSATGPQAPTIRSVSVAPNENNVLSAIVSRDVSNADSGHVVYWTGNEARQTTPFAIDLSSGRTLVLGLRPATRYNMYVEAAAGGTTAASDTLAFTTGALPEFLAASHLSSTTNFSDGYVIAALQNSADAYLTVFDSAGEVAWYRALPGETLAETKQQANGDFTAILTTSHGGEPVTGRAIEIAPDGSIVRTFTAPSSSPYFDDHEFWLLFDNGDYDGALSWRTISGTSICHRGVTLRTLPSPDISSFGRTRTATSTSFSMRGTISNCPTTWRQSQANPTSITPMPSPSTRMATTSCRGETWTRSRRSMGPRVI